MLPAPTYTGKLVVKALLITVSSCTVLVSSVSVSVPKTVMLSTAGTTSVRITVFSLHDENRAAAATIAETILREVKRKANGNKI